MIRMSMGLRLEWTCRRRHFNRNAGLLGISSNKYEWFNCYKNRRYILGDLGNRTYFDWNYDRCNPVLNRSAQICKATGNNECVYYNQYKPFLQPTSCGISTHDATVFFDVNESNFDSLVVKSSVPVILDLKAEWCGPCKKLAPILEKVVKAHRGKVVLAKLDTDECPNLSRSLQGMFFLWLCTSVANITAEVRGLPTVLAIYNGKVLDQFVGVQPDNNVTEFVQRAVDAAKKNSSDDVMV